MSGTLGQKVKGLNSKNSLITKINLKNYKI